MNWKEKYRSPYYLDAELPDPQLQPESCALLLIDVQNAYLQQTERATLPEAHKPRGTCGSRFTLGCGTL